MKHAAAIFTVLFATTVNAQGAAPSPSPTKIDAANFSSVCSDAKKHFASTWPSEVFDAPLSPVDHIKEAEGMKFRFQVAGFRVLIPYSLYETPASLNKVPLSRTFFKGRNGLNEMIILRRRNSKNDNTVEQFWESYSHHLDELKCEKFNEKETVALAALAAKEVDLVALAMKIKTLKVYKFQKGEDQGVIRAATGTRSNSSTPIFRAVLEIQNSKAVLTILATVVSQPELDNIVADFLNLGKPEPTPPWLAKMAKALEASLR